MSEIEYELIEGVISSNETRTEDEVECALQKGVARLDDLCACIEAAQLCDVSAGSSKEVQGYEESSSSMLEEARLALDDPHLTICGSVMVPWKPWDLSDGRIVVERASGEMPANACSFGVECTKRALGAMEGVPINVHGVGVELRDVLKVTFEYRGEQAMLVIGSKERPFYGDTRPLVRAELYARDPQSVNRAVDTSELFDEKSLRAYWADFSYFKVSRYLMAGTDSTRTDPVKLSDTVGEWAQDFVDALGSFLGECDVVIDASSKVGQDTQMGLLLR